MVTTDKHIMRTIQVTNTEWQYIQQRRIDEEQAIKRKQLQDNCKHPRKIYEGSFGHNGDSWYKCPDCKKNWSV